MYTFSVTQWIYGGETLEASLNRLRKYGYDGVELAGEPDRLDVPRVKRLLQQYDMVCTSICGIYKAGRDLSAADAARRAEAVDYVRRCVDLADELGARLVIVVPSPVGKTAPDTTRAEEWAHAVQSVREAGQYALSKYIGLAIEALNRYETYLVNNLQTAAEFVRQVNVGSVRLMADLFHMNIEERDICGALERIAADLIHVHIADNTREAAGLGRTNFAAVMDTLRKIGYRGAITMEFLPPVSNPYLAADREEAGDVFDAYTEQSIRHIKSFLP